MNSGPIFHAPNLTARYWKGMHSNGPFVASCDDVCSHKVHARYHQKSGLSCRYDGFTARWHLNAKSAVSKRAHPPLRDLARDVGLDEQDGCVVVVAVRHDAQQVRAHARHRARPVRAVPELRAVPHRRACAIKGPPSAEEPMQRLCNIPCLSARRTRRCCTFTVCCSTPANACDGG